MLRFISFITVLLIGILPAIVSAAPATQPAAAADTGLDDILSHATTAPATQAASPPASQPASPFAALKQAGRLGVITLSNGEKISGRITHTANKPLRMWVEKDQEYRDVSFDFIQRIDATVLWERDEKEWHFKESGSDIKEFNGKTYPNRETQYTFTLLNGQTLSGGVVEPLYLQTPDGPVLFALHKRDKGEVGQTLKQLVYVKSAEFK